MLKIKDLDLLILSYLSDKDVLNFCQINKYGIKLYNNEDFWRNRTYIKFGKIYPEEGQSYKEFYLKLVYFMDKYKYEKDNNSFEDASERGHLEVVKYLMSLDRVYNIDPSADDDYALGFASLNGHLEVVKYLISTCFVNPNSDDNCAIRWASEKGNLEVVKYLMSTGLVDPSAKNDEAIGLASSNGYLEVVEYLMSTGIVDPSGNDNYSIKRAIKNGHLDVIEYLLSLPKEHGVHL